jgi:hypothetical protein
MTTSYTTTKLSQEEGSFFFARKREKRNGRMSG